jgi:hypothetical protein
VGVASDRPTRAGARGAGADPGTATRRRTSAVRRVRRARAAGRPERGPVEESVEPIPISGEGPLSGLGVVPPPAATAERRELETVRTFRSRLLSRSRLGLQGRQDERDQPPADVRDCVAVRYDRGVAELVDEVTDEGPAPVRRERTVLAVRLLDDDPLGSDERLPVGAENRLPRDLGVHPVGPARLEPVLLGATNVDSRSNRVSVRPPLVVTLAFAPTVEVNDERGPVPSFPRELPESFRRGTTHPLDDSVVAVGLIVPLDWRRDHDLAEAVEPLGRGVPLDLDRDLESRPVSPAASPVGNPELAPLGRVVAPAVGPATRAEVTPEVRERKATIGREPPGGGFLAAPVPIRARPREGRANGTRGEGGCGNFPPPGGIRGWGRGTELALLGRGLVERRSRGFAYRGLRRARGGHWAEPPASRPRDGPARCAGHAQRSKRVAPGPSPGAEGVGSASRSVEEREDRLRSARRSARSRNDGSTPGWNGSEPSSTFRGAGA